MPFERSFRIQRLNLYNSVVPTNLKKYRISQKFKITVIPTEAYDTKGRNNSEGAFAVNRYNSAVPTYKSAIHRFINSSKAQPAKESVNLRLLRSRGLTFRKRPPRANTHNRTSIKQY